MSVTALADRPPTPTDDELELVKRTVAQGATPAELKLYLFDCKRRGVHPLDNMLHFTKRGGKYAPVTSIDFMRSRAADSGEMAGSDDPLFEPGAHPPVAAHVTVYRLTQGQRFAYTATARWAEYCPAPGAQGRGDAMWRKMPHTMLGKCAEALALRKAFPQQLAGLYTTEEMDQADQPTPTAPAPYHGPVTDQVTAPADTVIDTTTGEEQPAAEPPPREARPPAPPGYHYIKSYRFTPNRWHEFTISDWDADGGGLKVSTKRDLGLEAAQAFKDGLPVKLTVTMKENTVGEALLERIVVADDLPF